MTPAENKYCTDTIKLRDALEESFLAFAERLHNIHEKKLYEGQWDSFSEFVEELRISPATASKLLKIHSTLVLSYKVPKQKLIELGMDSSYEIAGVATSKEDALAWMKRSDGLRRDDIRAAISEKKSGIKQSDCRHPNMIQFQFCPDCKMKERI